jgi:hypothetical protein
MFERLLLVLKLEESVFVPVMKIGNGRKGDPRTTYTEHPPHFTKGLTLSAGRPGDGVTRWSVATHSGVGTGEGQILFSLGAKAFAEKVWAIEAGIECARALGVNVGDL